MLMEFTVIPLARGGALSADLAEPIGLIDESGLPYQVTAFGTLTRGRLGRVDEHCQAMPRGDPQEDGPCSDPHSPG